MKDCDIVLASGAEHLEPRFTELGYRVFTSALNYDSKRLFPNADIYARIEEVEELSGRRVVVVQSCTGSGPAENEDYTTSDRVVELLLLLDLLSRPVKAEKAGHKQYRTKPLPPPSRVEVVLTFQPFALQDKVFKTGEAVSGRWAIETIAKACNRVLVVSPHAPDSLEWVRSLKDRDLYKIVDVIPELVEFAKKQFGFEDPEIVAPDEGAQERYKCEGFGKTRSNSFKVSIHGELDVNGKDVILIDDLTKSGSTLLKATERLLEQGAREVVMAVAHVLPIVGKGEVLLEALIEKTNERIVTTNTIYTNTFCHRYPHLTYNVVDTIVKYI
jgi:phosphoribosylpyrophosphate synthetase